MNGLGKLVRKVEYLPIVGTSDIFIPRRLKNRTISRRVIDLGWTQRLLTDLRVGMMGYVGRLAPGDHPGCGRDRPRRRGCGHLKARLERIVTHAGLPRNPFRMTGGRGCPQPDGDRGLRGLVRLSVGSILMSGIGSGWVNKALGHFNFFAGPNFFQYRATVDTYDFSPLTPTALPNANWTHVKETSILHKSRMRQR